MKTEPKPKRMIVLERGIDPPSGQPMIYVGGLLPDVPHNCGARIEVYYDGILKSWLPMRPMESEVLAPDQKVEPSGSAFDLQVLDEPGVERVRVELKIGSPPQPTETLADSWRDEIYRRTADGWISSYLFP